MNSILVVEDNAKVLDNTIQFLLMEGYTVKGAVNGKQAVSVLSDFQPSLIISDILMPEMDGYELLKKVQEDKKTAGIPFIFLTAKAEIDDLRFGMDMGADDYLTKPFKFNDLLSAVETRLKKKSKIVKELEETKESISLYVPHELRTPLVSIMGYTDLLLEELNYLSKEEIKDMLSTIKKANRRLHKIIEKFLLYTQLNLDSLSDRFSNESFFSKYRSIKELILEEITILTESNGRLEDFKLNIEAEPPDLALMHIKFIISEIIENALKFSDRGSNIEVTTMNDKGTFTLRVKDYGRGMTNQEIKNISLFKQFDRNIYQQSGNGLGLITIKKILNLYNGELNINSSKGSFTEIEIEFQL